MVWKKCLFQGKGEIRCEIISLYWKGQKESTDLYIDMIDTSNTSIRQQNEHAVIAIITHVITL